MIVLPLGAPHFNSFIIEKVFYSDKKIFQMFPLFWGGFFPFWFLCQSKPLGTICSGFKGSLSVLSLISAGFSAECGCYPRAPKTWDGEENSSQAAVGCR